MAGKKKSNRKKRGMRSVIWILVCAIILSAVIIPISLQFQEEEEVADYFYVQIYNDADEVVSRYKISLTGTYAGILSRKITDVSITRESGDVCETSYVIDGYNVTVTIVHPVEGYLEKFFVLGSNGRFF